MSEVIHAGRSSIITKQDSGPDTVAVKRFTSNESNVSIEIYTHKVLQEIPGVVKYISSDSGFPKQLVLEYCANGSLPSYMQKRGSPFPEEELLVHFRSMISTVRAMHEHRYVHRALLAENWLVTSDGAIKLTDFGYAKLIPQGDSVQQHSIGPEFTNCIFVHDARKLGQLFLQIATMDFAPPAENLTPERVERRFTRTSYSDRVKDIVRALLFDERGDRQKDVLSHFNGLLGHEHVDNPEKFLLYEASGSCCSNFPCMNPPMKNLPCTDSFCSLCMEGFSFMGRVRCRICEEDFLDDLESTSGRPSTVTQADNYEF